ncbi:MAG: hypothetical protein QXU18_13250 [Thermoplasmatales archaeon]
MAQKGGGTNIGMMVLVLVVLLAIEGVVDVFGLPLDEILVPGEMIGDVLLVIMMALFSGVSGHAPRRLQ